jgi:hypothetical protein
MTKTEQLAERMKGIAKAHEGEISRLATSGPRGGSNAYAISGWSTTGNPIISKAAAIAGIPRMNSWSGKMPTPSIAIPYCIVSESRDAYNHIFGE